MDRMLPVVFVINQTGNRANGGVESITQVIEHLRDVKPIVITQREAPVNKRWRDAGAEVHVWPSHDTISPTQVSAIVRANLRMYRYLRSLNVKVVHCNDIQSLWTAAWGAWAARVPIVFNLRGVKHPSEQYGWHWHALRLSDRVVVLSKEMQTALEGRLPVPFHNERTRTRLEFIYSAVNVEGMHPVCEKERQELRKRAGIEMGAPAIGYIAAFNELKAQLRFIEEAGPLLAARLPQAQVYFVGDFRPEENSYARSCRETVQRLRLEETFNFVGYAKDVADWYRAVVVTVLASRREGLARSMIESLACGTPVVSFDVCSSREILEQHDCGLVVPQGNYRLLVDNMVRLIENIPLRERLGKNGHHTARRLFSPDEIVRKYEDIYQSLAER